MKIGVIGGGAAGFFGAIAAAEASPEAEVTLLEAGKECLAKVRISGGGRCNVTHACFDPAALVQFYPRGSKALRSVFSRFQPKDTIAWFTDRGVKLKTEADGRMFPITDDSGTIVDALMEAAGQSGVRILTQVGVTKISAGTDATGEPEFSVNLRGGAQLQFDRILLATGSSGQGYQLARDLGHQVQEPVPSLFTFTIRDRRLTDLAGVSVQSATVKLQCGDGTKLEQSGPLLVTHWGLSGPAVLKLSAWGARSLHQVRYGQNGTANLKINWLPKANPEQLKAELLKVKSQLARKSIVANCPVMLPKRLWESLCEAAGVQAETRWSDLSKTMLNALLQELFQGEYAIVGKGVFKEEFVTCGGVDLKQVDLKTMQSRICPGLYFAGEVLDIDGVTGGFNFQNAWSTGWIAGKGVGGEN